jgi:hypothetical protein
MTPMPGATSSTGVASTVTFRPMGAASVPSTMRAERSSIDVILQNYVFLVQDCCVFRNNPAPESQ